LRRKKETTRLTDGNCKLK